MQARVSPAPRLSRALVAYPLRRFTIQSQTDSYPAAKAATRMQTATNGSLNTETRSNASKTRAPESPAKMAIKRAGVKTCLR